MVGNIHNINWFIGLLCIKIGGIFSPQQVSYTVLFLSFPDFIILMILLYTYGAIQSSCPSILEKDHVFFFQVTYPRHNSSTCLFYAVD
jgi:hypothetical protein